MIIDTQSRIAILNFSCNNIMMPLDDEINSKIVDFDRNGGITGEGVQQSFTTEARTSSVLQCPAPPRTVRIPNLT